MECCVFVTLIYVSLCTIALLLENTRICVNDLCASLDSLNISCFLLNDVFIRLIWGMDLQTGGYIQCVSNKIRKHGEEHGSCHKNGMIGQINSER